MHLGRSSVAGSGVPPARKSADIIQGIQDAYTKLPETSDKVDALKQLFDEFIRTKLSVSGSGRGSFFKSKKDEASVIAAFRKEVDKRPNTDFKRDANAALNLLERDARSAVGGGGGAVSKSVAATELNPPRPPIHSVDNVVGGGAVSKSRSATPQEDRYPYISESVNPKSLDFKECAKVISAGGSSINILRNLMEVTPEDFHEGCVQMAVAHGIPRDSLPKAEVDSNPERVMTRLAATIDHIHSEQPKAATGSVSAGGGGPASAPVTVAPQLPKHSIDSVDGVVGGGAAATSRSAMPQEYSYPHISKNVNSKSPEFKACAEVIRAGESSIDVLRNLMEVYLDNFPEQWVQMAVSHGISGEAILAEAVASNTDLVMTRLAATIDHIHAERKPKAALRYAGGGGSAFRPYRQHSEA